MEIRGNEGVAVVIFAVVIAAPDHWRAASRAIQDGALPSHQEKSTTAVPNSWQTLPAAAFANRKHSKTLSVRLDA